MESALYEWFVCNQQHTNISGELLKEKGNIFVRHLYPEAISFEFSNGWLEKFKQRHAIRSFRRFGESGSVDIEKIKASLPSIREELDKWAWKVIYNMDETGLFYRMQANNSFTTKQLEGRKQNKERITIVICCNGDGSDKLPLWIIGRVLKPSKVSLLVGIVNVVASWSIDVKPHTIKNCFKHCKIRTDCADDSEVTKELDEEDQRIVADLRNQIKELYYNNQMDMDVFLDHPNEQQIVYALTEE
ncbi:hypothetical protein BUALT_Bualt01G0212700 [Buddleja alternifolia]|uniref:HTH CENPB-type domain-containing protein n=1 Tax=Buddleja alternifolia TaxID=168488 RepID=A0AAV6YHF1_9LAMI|nr:hypothetical protein BUALT_Bualt01G0212700 [Buddleja alternifolia]